MVDREPLEAIDALLRAHARPSVYLHRPGPHNDIPIGRSRFGGLPTLPDGQPWPVGATWPESGGPHLAPLNFLAQVDCAEVHRIDTRFPDRGILFFFAAVSGEQNVTDSVEGRSASAVIHCPDVPEGQAERPAPDDLPPCITSYHQDYVLPEEPGMSVYPQAPIWVVPTISYPDFGTLAPYGDYDRLDRAWPGGGRPDCLRDADSDLLWRAYEHRKGWLTLAALLPVVETAPENINDPGSGPEFDLISCTGAMHFITRSLITITALHLKHMKDHREVLMAMEEKARQKLASLPEPSRDPVDEAASWDFVRWLNTIAGLGGPAGGLVSKARLSGGGAADRHGFGRRTHLGPRMGVPNRAFSLARNELGLAEARKSVRVGGASMGGWFSSTQHPQPIDDPSVPLLSLPSEGPLEFQFHDLDELQFWIAPDDLAARRFDRARATIGGGSWP